MQGSFSEQSLKQYEELVGERTSVDYSELNSDVYDYTRCVRADGTVYGSRGKCRKGREAAAGAGPSQAPRKSTAGRMAAAAARLEQSKPVSKAKPKTAPMAKTDAVLAPKRKSREEHKKDVLKQIQIHEKTSEKSLNENLETLANLIKNEPGFKSPLTTSTLIALRALRMKAHLTKKEEQRKATQAIAKNSDELVTQSPKYKSTPGSSKPLPKVTKEGLLKDLNKELELKKRELEEAHPMDTRSLKVTISWLERDISNTERGDFSSVMSSSLSRIYEKQGYNSKPEVVAKRSDLESRSDIARNPDGRPIIAYRGVSSEEFSTQFKGGGSNGEVHFPGQGIYGNGSYAASSPLKGNTKHDKWAQQTAVDYSGEKREMLT